MRSNSNIIFCITTIILVVANIILFFCCRQLILNQNLNRYGNGDSYVEDIQKTVYHHLYIDGMLLCDTLELLSFVPEKSLLNFITQEEEKMPLVKLKELYGEKKMFFYFPVEACNNCVTEQLVKLDDLSKKIGRQNVVLLTDIVKKEIVAYMYSNHIKLPIYQINRERLGFSLPETYSILLIAEKNYIKTSFIMDMETKKFSDYFYNRVEKMFGI